MESSKPVDQQLEDAAQEEKDLISNLAATGDVNRSEVIQAERALNEAEAQLINRR